MNRRYHIRLLAAENRTQLQALIRSGDLGRDHLSGRCRCCAVYQNAEELAAQFREENLRYLDFSKHESAGQGETVFLFPGSGIHQKRMLSILSEVNSFFSERIRELDAEAAELYPVRLLQEEAEDEIINHLRVFVSELVIAEFWEKLGCRADHVIGHSMGEYAAAVFCGVMRAEDAMKLLICRCRVMQEDSPHQMSAVETTAENVIALAEESGRQIYISAYNGPDVVTVTAERAAMQTLGAACKVKKYRCSLINREHGGHYIGLAKSAAAFLEAAKTVTLNAPERHMISTVYPNGEKLPDHAGYWADHILRPVQFYQAVQKLAGNNLSRVIDVGVSPVLLSMTMKILGNIPAAWIPSVRAGRDYQKQMLHAAGAAFNSGIDIDKDFLIK